MRTLARLGVASAALCTGLGVLSGCTAERQATTVPLGAYQLVAFDSCDDALNGLRTAGKAAVGPYGFGGFAVPAAGGAQAQDMARVPAAKSGTGASAADPEYSGTNTHEAGVDEPDLVKTDGRRIVTANGNTLTVVDAASRAVTGTINLASGTSFGYQAAELLLAGDQALVLVRYSSVFRGGMVEDRVAQPSDTSTPAGPRLILVGLNGTPRVLSTMTADGSLLDARQVGSTVRVVLQSTPRIEFPYQQNATDDERIAANEAIIDKAPLDAWLPRIETTTGGSTSRTTIDCSAISRPDVYSGTNLLTVLSFTLGGATLGDGKPTSLVADGNTVYSNGPSLYVASDTRFAVRRPMAAPAAKPAGASASGTAATLPTASTQIYKFDTSAAQPTFAAGGSVPGYLINQYALSEWNGNLRVATTTPGDGKAGAIMSGVYVLSPHGRSLTITGKVEGLGKGEQIYAVRFLGPAGYVVTFRQTDPLYTVDLRDPANPAVRGELKIPGYSAYLHPVNDHQLLGVGQDGNSQGRVTGTQVSLFDVANLATPQRIAQYSLSGGYSEAEFNPHAFLYWPATGLVVVPLQTAGSVVPGPNPTVKIAPKIGALMLRVTGQTIQQVGFIQHPGLPMNPSYAAQIRRSLVIDTTLWTMSDAGLMATDLAGGNQLAWLPLPN